MSSDVKNGLSLVEVSEALVHMAVDDRDEMAALGLLLDWELVKFLERQGWSLLSLSFKWRDDEVLLVVKLLIDSTQYVGFVSRQSPISCVRTLVRKMRSKTLAFYPDKFA